ncbi:MAG: helix-turn-helix domain-containing protein [Bacillota bacterium]
MNFTEKLRRLTEDRNKAELARKAGLKPTTISDYVSKEYVPRADIALKMARVLEVPVDWLIDDSRDWPPPKANDKASVRTLSDLDLMREVCYRYRLKAVQLWQDLKEIETIDWISVAKALLNQPIDAPPPQSLAKPLRLAKSDVTWIQLTFYDPSSMASQYRGELPGDDISDEELQATVLIKRAQSLRKQLPGFEAINDWGAMRLEWEMHPNNRADVDAWRRSVLAQLDLIEQNREAKDSKGGHEPTRTRKRG